MEFHEKYKGQGLVVLMVSTESQDLVEKYVTDRKIPYPVAVADKAMEARYEVDGYPSAFLVDGDGQVAWAGHPMSLKSDKIEAVLRKLDASKSVRAPVPAAPVASSSVGVGAIAATANPEPVKPGDVRPAAFEDLRRGERVRVLVKSGGLFSGFVREAGEDEMTLYVGKEKDSFDGTLCFRRTSVAKVEKLEADAGAKPK